MIHRIEWINKSINQSNESILLFEFKIYLLVGTLKTPNQPQLIFRLLYSNTQLDYF